MSQPSLGDKVFYRDDGTNWRGDVTLVTDSETININVYNDGGYIQFGIVDAKLAVTPEDKKTDGHWWPRT